MSLQIWRVDKPTYCYKSDGLTSRRIVTNLTGWQAEVLLQIWRVDKLTYCYKSDGFTSRRIVTKITTEFMENYFVNLECWRNNKQDSPTVYPQLTIGLSLPYFTQPRSLPVISFETIIVDSSPVLRILCLTLSLLIVFANNFMPDIVLANRVCQ